MRKTACLLFAVAASALFAGCLYLPQERVTYTLNPAGNTPAAGKVSLDPAAPPAEIRAYLKVYSGHQTAPKTNASRLDEVCSVLPLEIKDGKYSVKPMRKRTWILVSFSAWTWRFPAAEIVFLADGREPEVVPLCADDDSLSYMAGILKPVPGDVSLAVPQNPASWERKIDALFLPGRDDFFSRNALRLIVGVMKQDALREFALKAYADLVAAFPEYNYRDRVEKKIELLKSPPNIKDEKSEKAREIVRLFSQDISIG